MSKRSNAVPKTIAFLFTGQGSQSVNMGRTLYETQPTFRQILEQCDEILRPLISDSILAVLYPDKETRRQRVIGDNEQSKIQNRSTEAHERPKSKIHDTAYTQPALFALEYALYQLWLSWGVKPDVVMGHSVGEYVAACVAGVFRLEDGLKLIAARGRLMGALPQDGDMVAILANEGEVEQLIAPHASEVAIAAVNGPTQVVISGRRTRIQQILADWHNENQADSTAIQNRVPGGASKIQNLNVSHAFHSPLMEPMLNEFAEVARQVTFAAPQIQFVANLTGKLFTGTQTTDAPTHWQYWVQQIRQPVRFADGMQTLQAMGANTFLEIGPKPVLVGMGRLCLEQSKIQNPKSKIQNRVPGGESNILWLPSLRTGQPDWEVMLESVGQLYMQGVEIDWQGFEGEYAPARRRVALPTYPFERKRYWIEPQPSQRGDPDLTGSQDLRRLTTHLTAFFQAQVVQTDLKERTAVSPDLEALSRAYVVAALTKLGFDWQIGQRWNNQQLARQLAVVPRHQRLLARIVQMLAEAGIVRQEGEQWGVVQAPSQITPQQIVATFPSRLAENELTLLSRCGEKLAAVLCGQQDPLMLLFPEGDSSGVARFYQEAPEARLMNQVIAQAMQHAIAQRSSQQTLRILEIGAGTGGTTRSILPHLPAERTEYTFTDVGRSFLTRAQKTFHAYGFIQYCPLDIEADPSQQGFAPQHYELVIAANVLHATADLRQTVRHVRQLLKPGGLLLLRETTRRVGWLDLTFGLTEGWWRFRDWALRPTHALLAAKQWQTLLQQSGFQGVAYLPDETMPISGLDETFIVAQADEVVGILATATPTAIATNSVIPSAFEVGDSQANACYAHDEVADASETILLQQLALMQQQLLTWDSYPGN